jgi:hypothetical protein
MRGILSFVALCVAILVAIPSAEATGDDLLLYSPILNYAIANRLCQANRYLIVGEDNVAMAHAPINGSFSTWVNGMRNPLVIGAASAELLALFTSKVTTDFQYLEISVAGTFNVTGVASVASGLAFVLYQAGMVGQYHVIGDCAGAITQLDLNTFVVSTDVITFGQAPDFGVTSVLSYNDLRMYVLPGNEARTFHRVIRGEHVCFIASRIFATGNIATHLGNTLGAGTLMYYAAKPNVDPQPFC